MGWNAEFDPAWIIFGNRRIIGLSHYEAEHLPGAINVPHDEVDALAPALLPDRDAAIVVYCASGPCQNSGIAARRLVALGYSDVSDYHEGKAEWIAAGLPVETGVAAAAGARSE